MNILILQASPRANGNTAWMAEEYKNAAEAAGHKVTLVNAPAKVKKMALLMSSYSPGVYSGATAEYHDICNYWKAEDSGIVTAKIDEQKTNGTKQKIQAIVNNL